MRLYVICVVMLCFLFSVNIFYRGVGLLHPVNGSHSAVHNRILYENAIRSDDEASAQNASFARNMTSDLNASSVNASLEIKPRQSVSVHLEGGLGNQLFQAASSHGIAVRRNAGFWCIENLEGSALQRSVVFVVQPNCYGGSVASSRLDENGKFLEFQEWMMMKGDDSNVVVGRFLQSYKYFANNLPFELKSLDAGRKWVSDRGIQVVMS
jgi:hypothetical protein